MKITSLRIERFGVWEDLNLPKISRGLNVFFGPNEAGKTTLMQFIRTCLYGGGDDERARYIQMALDGRRRRATKFDPSLSRPDPRRVDPNAVLDDRSNVPPEIRRFLDAGKKSDVAEQTPSSAQSAAQNVSNAWIGGSATVTSDFGDHRIERRYIRRDLGYQSPIERKAGFVVSDGLLNWSGRFYSLPGQKIAESLIITGPDGTRVGDYLAKSLTCNLDESTYNGVFAIGLDELQRLSMLNETEAAQMLYRLSVGVDRGSFVQVFQQIVAERNDLLDVKGRPSILENLIEEREKARSDAGESAGRLREYARLLEDRRAVLESVQSLQERLGKAARQKQLRELAVRAAPTWDERSAARAELLEMGDVPKVEQSAVDESAALIATVNATRAKIKGYKSAFLAKRDERDANEVDPALDELALRVTILEDDLPRLSEIDEKVAELRKQLADLKKQLAEEEARVRSARDGKIMLTQSAMDAINASIVSSKMAPEVQLGQSAGSAENAAAPAQKEPVVTLPNKLAESGVPFKEVEDFKIPARAVRRRRLKLQKYREELAQVTEKLNELVAKLEQGLTSRQQKNLTEAIERTGALVTGLRRRIEIDRRVGEMASYRKELERQNRMLAENQAIVGPPFYALSTGAFVGALLFAFALFNKVELVYGLLGLLLSIGCLFYKTSVERRNRLKLEDNQRRLGLLTKQLEQAHDEAKKIDDRFPAPVGMASATFESRLQKARTDLTFFESLAPVEAQWREVVRQHRAYEARVKSAEVSLKKARKRWRSWLHSAYLPPTLTPTQVRDLLGRVGIAEDLRRQIEAVHTEVDYLGRERRGIIERFDSALALVEKYNITEKAPALVTPKLRKLLDDHAEVLGTRAALLEEMNSIKKNCRKAIALRRRQVREVRRFLSGYGVKSQEELVAAVDRYSLFLQRRANLEAVQQRLDAAIAGFCPEDEIGELLLNPETREDLPKTIENLTKRIDAFNAELKGKLELSGRLGQQADAIAAKKDSIKRRFDAISADLRLARMAELWRSRAVAGQMMEDIRRAYEKERQPETLREASRYLKRLTNGMYVNIWTPLGEDALYVDAANGETLDVGALSRGTREVLFIAIRLALVVSFEKHGVQMPLIWDDVLVNFDSERAATAAKLLVDFAKAGRQIFLFTCHRHICQLFLRLGVPVCVLPTQTDPAERKFRVLTPVKKASSELSVDGATSDAVGLSFVEEPNNLSGDSFAVGSAPTDEEDDALERVEYVMPDAVGQFLETFVEASADISELDETLKVNVEEASNVDVYVDPEPQSEPLDVCVDEPSEPSLGADSFVYTTTGDEAVEYVPKRSAPDAEDSEQRHSLSEISSTFSSSATTEGEFQFVEGAAQEERAESAFDSDEKVDYVEVDPTDGLDDVDSDWNNVLGGFKDVADDESQKPFSSFMVAEDDSDEYADSEFDSDEYEEETDEGGEE